LAAVAACLEATITLLPALELALEVRTVNGASTFDAFLRRFAFNSLQLLLFGYAVPHCFVLAAVTMTLTLTNRLRCIE
jgi:hypothetical protein